ncbi:MAG: SDR family oxidoreductase [Candidatus Eremiobacteraeota bacterium]|nr:SDR family oxidoreductase [Candidatus Eremiobacteraeota bacterium]
MERSVLVTGASSGIGEATARHLAARGWRVFAGVRRDEDAARVATDAIRPLIVDVTNSDDLRRAYDAVASATQGRLDGLVANAGIAVPGPLEAIDENELRKQLEVNVIGTHATIRAFLPLLRAARGRIAIVGSIGGRSAFPFIGAYVTSKFALEGYADALRLELLPSGIEVSLLEPGSIATPIWTKGREEYAARLAAMTPEQQAAYGTAIARMRGATKDLARSGSPPQAVAATIERALTARSPKARYVVGGRARVQSVLARILPDRAKDRLIARMLDLRKT